MENPKFNLNRALGAISARYDEKQREEQEKRNQEGRKRLTDNRARHRIAKASALELDILQTIDFLQTLPKTPLIETRMQVANERLAELLAEQGKYEAALSVSQDPKRREWYQTVYDAIKRPDHEQCDCPPDQFVDRATNQMVRESAIHNKIKVISEEHGQQEVMLQICRKCGSANAK